MRSTRPSSSIPPAASTSWCGQGDDATGEDEIHGQRISSGGVEVGADDFRISDMGPDGSSAYGAQEPDVAHNPGANTYLVAWEGDDDTGLLVDGEFEIHVQSLDASGAEIGVNDRRISDAGGLGDAARDAINPAVAHNAVDGQFLVAWDADEIDLESGDLRPATERGWRSARHERLPHLHHGPRRQRRP